MIRSLISVWLLICAMQTWANPTSVQQTVINQILDGYQQNSSQPFSAAAGESLWRTSVYNNTMDKPVSCQSCHGLHLSLPGKHLRTGKPIDPMAPSANADRLTDPRHIQKWLARNCKFTLGRACSDQEKGDLLTWLLNQ